ncbi:gamma-glutamylcyclotransferase family protein [Effusibacillus pohliae]|uniref:gamma-glutamylcyclotransferase family protein n=1 Tax=Effusibacillus pohliae TaxID=232270 RepID=UPI000360677F|nr:gamma-glutamylcyclotransferase family protein [Effusibacillus pohliae]
MISVFVYGTLLTGEVNHRVAAPYLHGVQPGCVRGRLYDVGVFPALVLDTKGYEIRGEWFDVTEEGLRTMDQLEGYHGPGQENLYERVWVSDVGNGRSGWVYVWPDSRGYPEISVGSWREYRSVRGVRA